MLTMLTYAGVIVIGGLLIIAFMAMLKPDRFVVTRSLAMRAPAESIFPHINRLSNFGAWSPWQRKDPEMAQSFSSIPEGVGNWLEWKGNNQVGAGRMTITESRPAGYVRMQLDFKTPMKATNEAVFTLAETDGQTVVTWTMTGAAPFMTKLIDVVLNMNRMIGRDFESGLESLKEIVER